MMQRKHPGEAMTGEPGALPGEAIRVLIQIVAPHCNQLAPPYSLGAGLFLRLELAPFAGCPNLSSVGAGPI